MELIGREYQQEELADIFKSKKSELVAILGRRRVGKTYLIRKYFAKQMTFEFTGMDSAGLPEHMERFSKKMGDYFFNGVVSEQPKNWFKAFDQLEKALTNTNKKKKKVIFLDELPWMGMSHISFKNAFTLFWNDFAAMRNDIIVIFTGSSTAWLYNKVFSSKGGLFQRVTRRIFLSPFTLYETEQFIKSKNLPLNRYAILDFYMILGGIPFYLDLIKQGESVIQTIDRLFFRPNAELRSEFSELFRSLFNNGPIHKDIINTLAQHPSGLERNEIIEKIKYSSGGQFSSIVDELENCGFILSQVPFGKKNKDKKYILSDAYTLFYLKFVQDNKEKKWTQLAKTQTWISWSGIAFENTCKMHIPQIKGALRIGGVLSSHSGWHHRGNSEMSGAQIDLLIDRDDKVVNICEMKYYNNKIVLTKEMADNIRTKMASFQYHTGTKKTLMPILLSPYGINDNMHSNGFIQKSIELNHLFEKVND
jgi:uncharacterized protein